MTFAEYLREVAKYYSKHINYMRPGQAYFNCLPDKLAASIKGLAIDPFYDDSKLPHFLAYVEASWPEGGE